MHDLKAYRLLAAAVGLSLIVAVVLSACGDKAMSNDFIVINDDFTITADSVVEDSFVARAMSPTHIVSTYYSQPSDSVSPVVAFRLWIGGRDNELPVGKYHHVLPSTDTTVVAGVTSDSIPSASSSLGPNTKWTVRVDVSKMEQDFKEHGWHVTATGDTVFAADFNGIWLTGNVPPLRSDAYGLQSRSDLKLHPHFSRPGIYEATITLNAVQRRAVHRCEWKTPAPNGDFPTFESGQLLVDALYNMAVDNINRNFTITSAVRPSSSEVCYPIMLALSYLAPYRSIDVLKGMVHDGRLIPGSSGSIRWPVVSGFLVWAAAAWEVYNVTGDKAWLRYAYNVVSASVEAGREVETDPVTGLMHGGSPCLSVNPYYYPQWMEPKDVFESQSLYVNIIYQHAYELLSEMGDELDIDNSFGAQADRLKDALNHTLWNESCGRYMQYVYGSAYPMQSPFVDNMGQALSILWDIADDDRASTLIEESPVTNYGVPSVYPRRQGLESVGNAVHPLVQALWNLAAKKTGNTNMLRRGLGAMYRLQALSCATSPLCDPSTGDIMGGVSAVDGAAGNVAMVFRVFAGMRFLPDGIEFNPLVPDCFKGNRQIKNFNYRKSVLDITVEGTGNDIEWMKIDGSLSADNFFPATLTGHHSVIIKLKKSGGKSSKVKIDPNVAAVPVTPSVLWGQHSRIVNFVPGQGYRVVVNGQMQSPVSDTSFACPSISGTHLRVLCLAPVNKWGSGYASRPWVSSGATQLAAPDPCVERGTRFVSAERAAVVAESSGAQNASMPFTVDVDKAGVYMLSVRYANGNSSGHCAVRSVEANTHRQGVLVMPCRGRNQWMTMGWSNMLPVELLRGRNAITITVYNPQMPGFVNSEALIQHIRLMPL